MEKTPTKQAIDLIGKSNNIIISLPSNPANNNDD